jgi:tetratricopeptide (TPR) repeat protein
LEHPGIVPVHDLNTDADGKPYYVMKFVEGRSLREAIAEFHAGAAASDATAQREVQKVRLLECFAQLCQTVAYAHSCGVLHRDLKPEHVILGPYGETVILDWGLAKVLGRPDAFASSGGVHVSSGSSSETLDGSVLGTPAYMPPELAAGRATEADERTDVYLLGAMLHEILTGQAPRQGASRNEMIEMARTVTPLPPRKIKADVPRELDAVCRRAMAWRPQDRYAKATDVAAEIHRYLAGEAVATLPEGAIARTWRWCKRRRRLVARLLASVALVGLALVAWWWIRDEQGRRVAAERETQRLIREQQGRKQIAEFRRLADATQFFAASTNPEGEHTPYYAPAQAVIEGRKALELARTWGPDFEHLPVGEEHVGLKGELADLILLLAEIGSLPAPSRDEAHQALANLDWVKTLRAPTRSYHRLRAVFHQTCGEDSYAKEHRLLAANHATPTTAFDHFLRGEDFRFLATQPEDKATETKDWKPRREPMEQAIAHYRLALENSPQHYWSHFQLGRCSLSLGRHDEAIAALGACIALAPSRPWGYSARGLALALRGRLTDAAADFEKALALDPEFLPARLNRGVIAWRNGKRDDALADFAAVLDVPPERRLAEAYYYRGRLAVDAGDLRKGLADLDQAIRNKPGFRPAYLIRAQTSLLQGNFEDALADLDRFLLIGSAPPQGAERHAQRGRLLRTIVTDLPSAKRSQAMWKAVRAELIQAEDGGARSASLYNDLGAVRLKLSERDKAIEAFTNGLEREPKNLVLLLNRGWALVAATRAGEAQEDFRAATRIAPLNAEAHTGLGYAFADAAAATTDGQVAALREALLGVRHAAGDYRVFHNVACIYGRLSQTIKGREQEYQDLTITMLEQAVDLWRERGGPSEIEFIQREGPEVFPQSLRQRPEFKKLIEAPQR